jgi:hypothetical protein
LIRTSNSVKLKVQCLKNCPTIANFRERKAAYLWKVMYMYSNASLSSFIYVEMNKDDPDPPIIGE